MENLTVAESIWLGMTIVGIIVTGRLFLRSTRDLHRVFQSKINGARILAAKQAYRRNAVRLSQMAVFFGIALLVGLVDRLPIELRWITPVALTYIVASQIINAYLDDRAQDKLVSYLKALEQRNAVQIEETKGVPL